MPPDIYDHIADCHSMLSEFLRFNKMLPSMFATATSGAKRHATGAVTPQLASIGDPPYT